MKNIFNASITASKANLAVLILRIAVAAFMLTHGIPKLMMLLSGDIQFLPVMGLSAEVSLGLAVFAEVVCSILILFGLGTRLAVIPLLVTMLIAVFYVHISDPFGKMEMGLLYLVSYVVILITGAGKYSLDYLVRKSYLNSPASHLVVGDTAWTQ